MSTPLGVTGTGGCLLDNRGGRVGAVQVRATTSPAGAARRPGSHLARRKDTADWLLCRRTGRRDISRAARSAKCTGSGRGGADRERIQCCGKARPRPTLRTLPRTEADRDGIRGPAGRRGRPAAMTRGRARGPQQQATRPTSDRSSPRRQSSRTATTSPKHRQPHDQSRHFTPSRNADTRSTAALNSPLGRVPSDNPAASDEAASSPWLTSRAEARIKSIPALAASTARLPGPP